MVLRRPGSIGLRVARVALGFVVVHTPALSQTADPAPRASVVAPPLSPVPVPAPTVAPAPVAPSTLPVVAPETPRPAPVAGETQLEANGPAPEAQPVPSEFTPPINAEELPAAVDEDWYGAFQVRVFADAYYSLNYNFPKPQVGGNDVIRAYDSANGFSLAWAGLDISHPADPVGGTLALRFGPSAKRYNSSCFGSKCDADYDLTNVKQAFASWRPGGASSPVSIDLGKFDTIYGAEVADSQDNINYTRGVLYWLGQPLFHTGLRVNAELGKFLSLRALAVNGWNNSIDNNAGKSFGLQATVHAGRADGHDLIAASIGYLGGPERDDIGVVQCSAGSVFDPSSASGCSVGTNGATSGTVGRASSNSKGLRHFLDLVVTVDPIESLHMVLNADFGVENVRDPNDITLFQAEQWWGAMLGGRYLFSDKFAVAGRGEYYHDDDGVTTGSVDGRTIGAANIYTGTVTLDYLPTKNLVLRLDNRVDHSDKEIFPKNVRDLVGTLVTSTLGVVVTTN